MASGGGTGGSGGCPRAPADGGGAAPGDGANFFGDFVAML